MPSPRTVAIVHPWFPQYRAPFFEGLIENQKRSNTNIHVFYGAPPPEWEERGDSLTTSYATELPTRFIRLGGKSLSSKRLSPLFHGPHYDLVILEQAVRNLETYRLLASRYANRLAFWGHGKSYTLAVSTAQERAKRLLTNRGKWFFGYTEKGVEAAISGGFPRNRTTIVRNSVDTTSLREGIARVSIAATRDFKQRNDLHGTTALFIGGLDSSKRLDFLIEAAHRVHGEVPGFRLLVIGDGAERAKVQRAAEASPVVRYLGPLFGEQKYVAMRASQAIAMPGRVGLVAVDSLASGLPIVTTNWPFHAPEYEYLSAGKTAVVTDDDVMSYARGMADLIRDKERLSKFSARARSEASGYSIDRMIENFAGGIYGALRATSP